MRLSNGEEGSSDKSSIMKISKSEPPPPLVLTIKVFPTALTVPSEENGEVVSGRCWKLNCVFILSRYGGYEERISLLSK